MNILVVLLIFCKLNWKCCYILNYSCIYLESFLNYFWITNHLFFYYSWIALELLFFQSWNTLEIALKYLWNILRLFLNYSGVTYELLRSYSGVTHELSLLLNDSWITLVFLLTLFWWVKNNHKKSYRDWSQYVVKS